GRWGDPEAPELGPERVSVDQIAVVPERELAEVAAHHQRLGVLAPARSSRGVASVADRREAGQPREVLLLERLADQSHAGMDVQLGAVRGGDAGALLTPVLGGGQP